VHISTVLQIFQIELAALTATQGPIGIAKPGSFKRYLHFYAFIHINSFLTYLGSLAYNMFAF
jgi:hypothetical protein